MMLTQKDAKTMAKSLRDVLGDRNVPLSHSECLEIVARQFGLDDWNTLLAKLVRDETQHAQLQDSESATSAGARNVRTERVRSISPTEVEPSPENNESVQTTQTVAPWTTCSFCGKSRPEVRIMLGGCGGWEGFRKRRNPENGERSNVFICNECIALCARIVPNPSLTA